MSEGRYDAFAGCLRAGPRDEWGVNLTVDDYGLAIGNVPRVNGLRINLRDSYLEEVNGINLGGLATVSEKIIEGFTFGGYKIEAEEVRWASVAGWRVEAEEIRGLSIAVWNDAKRLQTGLSIGLYNSTDELHGIQLGLLNRAGNHRSPFRYLPLLNAHFD